MVFVRHHMFAIYGEICILVPVFGGRLALCEAAKSYIGFGEESKATWPTVYVRSDARDCMLQHFTLYSSTYHGVKEPASAFGNCSVN